MEQNIATAQVSVARPNWDKSRLVSRIVHLGCGAFHRAHQALFTHHLLEKSDSDWGICEVNLMPGNDARLIANLKAQNLLYTVAERGAESTELKIIGSMKEALHPEFDGHAGILAAMARPETAIVSLTVTEKGYCTDPASGELDVNNPLIQNDLAHPQQPKSAIGYIVEALNMRREQGLKAFTVLSCDNVRENGHVAKAAVLGLAKARDAALAACGCRASDHGIETLRFAPVPDDAQLDAILGKRLAGETLSELEIAQFTTAVLVWLGRQYAARGWVMQLHIGAIRNNNTRMFRLLGPDTGFDSIGDNNISWALSRLLDSMDVTNELPKTILYCLNPRDNEVLATMIGNFQGPGIAGKVQFGSGWWFNDQKDGMLRQLEQLSQMGLLSQFVGMLTDSRSFLSYTRHEYFRRILCNLLGQWAQDGEIPDDEAMLSRMVQDICFNNAQRYFTIK
ncbi:hypothetical protein JS43_12370 [Salmonella enterica subsp. enterica serovar Rissen]|nr:hypothetical protein [Salmonella enterica]ECM0447973.1 hypothetical protein [Salmonella enterica subsp. enterica serovar Rissen]EDC7760892.1 hypothetical protein [Salmonella enterica subsp. enterica serovar Rissen]EDG7980334.1 hypothetical protein [Salmonella enterica subsp. enterica serovar Rissen]EGK7441144.1 hypothetical protein [Salmonella enterica]